MLVFIRDSENCKLPEDEEKIILSSFLIKPGVCYVSDLFIYNSKPN